MVNDKGVDGLVIKIDNDGIAAKGERLECAAGALLARAVSAATMSGLAGLEWAAGVPGTVGGAVRGNAGCFGSDTSAVLETAAVFDPGRGKFLMYSKNDCQFGYRESIFKKARTLIVWEAVFKLHPGNHDDMNTLIDEILDKRAQAFPRLPSAGSVFKNLYIRDIESRNPELAAFLNEHQAVREGKVGTRRLIDKLDLGGKTIGGAKISLEHTNFIVNTGKATAEDVIMLISLIKEKARRHLNILLQEEIQYFGFGDG